MKYFSFSLLLSLVSASLTGQINLEHSYPATILRRDKLEVSGEKYYYADTAASVVRFFNADHTSWKNVPITVPAGANYMVPYLASEHIFNQDDAMEFALISGGDSTKYTIYDETGEVLLEASPPIGLNIVQVNGEWRVLLSNGTVLSADGLTFEHSFPQFTRVLPGIEGNGDKYFYQDNQGAYWFFNADYTLWKKIVPQNINSNCYSSEIWDTPGYQVYDDDANLEILVWGYCSSTNNYEIRVLDESGEVQFQYQNGVDAGFFFPIRMPDGAGGYQFVEWYPDSANIYSLPEFEFVQHYPFEFTDRVLSVSGYKFFPRSVSTTASSFFQFYHADLTPWKQLPKPAGYTASIIFNAVDEHLFTDDNTLSAGVYYTTAFGFGTKVLTETGAELLSVPNANDTYVSNIPGLPRKLIAGYYGADTTIAKFTNVYSLPGPAPNPAAEQSLPGIKIEATPNPFSNKLTVDLSSIGFSVSGIAITDAMGRRLLYSRAISGNKWRIESMETWSPGIYFLQVMTADGRIFSEKIIKN